MRCLNCAGLTVVNIIAITFSDLLSTIEETSNTFPRILFPAWFPVGLDSTTGSHLCELWKMKGMKILFTGGRSCSRYPMWSLQELQGELLQSIHISVPSSCENWWGFLGITHFSAVGCARHLDVPEFCSSSNVSSEIHHFPFCKLSEFMPFLPWCPTIMDASHSIIKDTYSGFCFLKHWCSK